MRGKMRNSILDLLSLGLPGRNIKAVNWRCRVGWRGRKYTDGEVVYIGGMELLNLMGLSNESVSRKNRRGPRADLWGTSTEVKFLGPRDYHHGILKQSRSQVLSESGSVQH